MGTTYRLNIYTRARFRFIKCKNKDLWEPRSYAPQDPELMDSDRTSP